MFSLGNWVVDRQCCKCSSTYRLFCHVGVGNGTIVRISLLNLLLDILTSSRYFSFVFAASKMFSAYINIASGTTMALFGLSPLFLSSLASTFFANSSGSFEIMSFLRFMAVFAGFSHLMGAVVLDVGKVTPPETRLQSLDITPDETTSLLQRQRSQCEPSDSTVFALLRDPYLWVLCLYLIMTLGMVRSTSFH